MSTLGTAHLDFRIDVVTWHGADQRLSTMAWRSAARVAKPNSHTMNFGWEIRRDNQRVGNMTGMTGT
jgi:hypothetical protein